eukprot:6300090-Pyramimonas_sp.AAC.1
MHAQHYSRDSRVRRAQLLQPGHGAFGQVLIDQLGDARSDASHLSRAQARCQGSPSVYRLPTSYTPSSAAAAAVMRSRISVAHMPEVRFGFRFNESLSWWRSESPS